MTDLQRVHNLKSGPIGIFDSGVGGLTIMEEIVRLLPEESYVYYADSGNCPYGDRTREEIMELASGITGFLIEHDCKIIVVACNTITTNIIDELRLRFPVPFVGMEPAIKPAAKLSKNGKVAVLATKGTIEGELYNKTRGEYAAGVDVFNQIGVGLVDLIERDQIDSPAMQEKLEMLIRPMLERDVDTLVLGCTHYNYLVPQIKAIAGPQIRIVNSAGAVAKRVQTVLMEKHLLRKQNDQFRNIYTTGDPNILRSILRRLSLGKTELYKI